MRRTINGESCWVCGNTYGLHVHEILFGSKHRKLSIKHGLCVNLCGPHHNLSNNGVHFNPVLDLELKQLAQRTFEEEHSHDEWMKVFGKNYL